MFTFSRQTETTSECYIGIEQKGGGEAQGVLRGKNDRDDRGNFLENYPKKYQAIKFAHPKIYLLVKN